MAAKLDHTVIIGGGIAGLIAARVLSEVSPRITILEAGSYDEFATLKRRGAGSSMFIHNWVSHGARLFFGDLFPGFVDEVLEAGGESVTAHRVEVDRTFPAPYLDPRWDDAYPTIVASRRLMERAVHRRVTALDAVTLREDTRVNRLRIEGGAVRGVDVKTSNGAESINCDLVVDATGYPAVGTRLLEKAGLAGPRTITGYEQPLYTCRWFEADERLQGDQVQSFDRVRQSLNVLACKQEKNLWVVTLSYHPPSEGGMVRTERGFERRARLSGSPLVRAILDRGEPWEGMWTNQMTTPRFHLYPEWDARPDGFLPFGGAMCFLPGITGQGLHIATSCGRALRAAYVERGAADPLAHYLREAHLRMVVPWFICNHAFPSGIRPRAKSLGVQALFGSLISAMPRSRAVAHQIKRIVHGLDPWQSFLAPRKLAGLARDAVVAA